MISFSIPDVLAFAAAALTLLLLLDRQSLLREMKRTRREVKALRNALEAQGKPTRRSTIPPWLRQRVIERCEYQCQYCGGFGDAALGPDGITWHVDHVIPVSKGGPTHEGNLTLSCEACNLAKGIQPAMEFQTAQPLALPEVQAPEEIHEECDFPLAEFLGRSHPPTADDAEAMRVHYRKHGSKTSTCRYFYGQKDDVIWGYVTSALEGRI